MSDIMDAIDRIALHATWFFKVMVAVIVIWSGGCAVDDPEPTSALVTVVPRTAEGCELTSHEPGELLVELAPPGVPAHPELGCVAQEGGDTLSCRGWHGDVYEWSLDLRLLDSLLTISIPPCVVTYDVVDVSWR